MEITILYEDTHTGKRPEWMALECNWDCQAKVLGAG